MNKGNEGPPKTEKCPKEEKQWAQKERYLEKEHQSAPEMVGKV